MDGVKDILQAVIQKMETVETFTKLNGEEKKMRVMSSLKCFLTDREIEKYGDFISGFVDVICDIARGSDSIRINDMKKFFSCCL